MPRLDIITLICLAGLVVSARVCPRLSRRVWYRDEEGDGVSARSVCWFLGALCLVVLVLKLGRLF